MGISSRATSASFLPRRMGAFLTPGLSSRSRATPSAGDASTKGGDCGTPCCIAPPTKRTTWPPRSTRGHNAAKPSLSERVVKNSLNRRNVGRLLLCRANPVVILLIVAATVASGPARASAGGRSTPSLLEPTAAATSAMCLPAADRRLSAFTVTRPCRIKVFACRT